MAITQQLPIGVSTLEIIIQKNRLYIDKTELIYNLITNNDRCFFSRPRRFGKSLLISTMKEIFLGNKELFKNLWIGQEGRHAWEKRPVIHIDFSAFDSTDHESLRTSMNLTLDAIAEEYNCTLAANSSPDDKVSMLARHLATTSHTKVAVLIDEYDSPMLKHINDQEKAEEIRNLLSSFYSTIKSLDTYINFTFVTGVTKFSKTSLFSGANNLHDISMNRKFSTLCGYTEAEITANLSSYIEDYAQAKNLTSDQVRDEMRYWYNGYRFSDTESTKVYNPYSVMLYLANQVCKNYWFATGTPTFLIKLIKKNFYTFANIDHSTTDTNTFDKFEIGKLPIKTILYQAGYLTIEGYDEKNQTYQLTYPNEEVRQSLNETLLRSVLSLENESIQVIAQTLRNALYTKNIAQFCSTLQILFAHIPYRLHIKKEAFYHALLQMICYVLGMQVMSEVSVAGGIIDMVIQTDSTIYVFELKLNQTVAKTTKTRSAAAAVEMMIGKKAEKALKQIHDRRYYEKYLLNGKEICLVGLVFNHSTKAISHVVEWLKDR